MEKADLDYFRKKLETEKAALEEALGGIARINPKNPNDWEAVPAESDETTFRDEVADRLEELDDRAATVGPLEIRLHDIRAALEQISQASYGFCAVCQKPIERERLEASPAAATCKQHLEQGRPR
ncbi:MAG: hypothetical protein HYT47_01145 [Candidatus Vogelbacteria bacterium]|nr:hypothetical protein [Candidatus Vogelbacteria bacterium]